MELRATREMRRNEQLRKAGVRKSETPAAPSKGGAQPLRQAPADKLALSRQALDWLDRQNQEAMERKSAQSGSKSELDIMEKQLKAQEKCQKIAARIMRGDRVPPEDLEYLMNNDPEGYKLAMAMRRRNPDPEDEKSVLDDEDKNGSSVEGAESGGGEAPGVSATEASSGGGEAPPTSE